MRIAAVIALAAVGLAAAGCQQAFKAPYDQGVCYYVVPDRDDPKADPRLNVVARDQESIDFCAARLEEMRLRFLRMGGSNREVVGAYQGRFIFVDRQGVKYGTPGGPIDGARFFALARTGDGRLAIPGAIMRDEATGRPLGVGTSAQSAPPSAPAPTN